MEKSYDFTIVHRPGNMQHVDALSRIHFIQSTSVLYQIRRAQEEDEFILNIINKLKEKQVDDYVMHNGILCKFADTLYQIVVPETMSFSIITKAHQDGHFKHQKFGSSDQERIFHSKFIEEN